MRALKIIALLIPFGGYVAAMMDGMLGAMYDDGLARLKDVVESKPAE